MMVFFLFFSALFLEVVASYFSIVGLIATFSFSLPIILLALALDCAKLASVTFLYREWIRVSIGMKLYLIPASCVLVFITTIGSYGFLIEHFQQSIASSKQSNIQITSMVQEKQKLEQRKIEIDKQIANLPDNSVRGRTKLLNSFKNEIEQTNLRIIELDKELPLLQQEQVKQDVHIGPIAVLAHVFNTDLEKAVQWVVLLIVSVMDPLAVILLLAGNKQMMINKERKKDVTIEDITPKEVVNEMNPFDSIVENLKKHYNEINHVQFGAK